jgi:hypothetical protein
MMGNKPGSHKAKKKTRSLVTKASIILKRKLNLTTPVASVTQTQGDEVPIPITASPHYANPLSALVTVSSRLLSTLNSPVADGVAISDMVSGLPLRRLDYIQTDVVVPTATITRPPITQELPGIDNTPQTVDVDDSLCPIQDPKPTGTAPNDTGTAPAVPALDGIAVRQIALSKFKKKTGRIGVFKLTAQSVHNAL